MTTTAPGQAPVPVDARAVLPSPVPALDVVVPVYNEAAGLESCLRRLHAHLAAEFPYRFRITVADNASTDATLAVARRVAARAARDRRGPPGREGPRPGAAGGLVGLGRAGAGVPGRGPVHRPGRAGPAGRAAAVRALGPGHRHPAAPRLAGGPRGQAGGDLPRLQPDAARHAGGPVLRRPVRLQGDPRRRGRRAAAAGRGRPAGSSTPSCWCSPSGPGCGSTRCRWTGSTTPTAGWTSCATALADLRGVGRLGRALATGRLPVAALRAQLGRAPLDRTPGVPAGLTRQLVALRRDRGRQHAGVPGAVPAASGRRWARSWRTCWRCC